MKRTGGACALRATVVGALAVALEGCFLFNTVDPDGGVADGARPVGSDARVDGGSGDGSGAGGDAACMIGRERLCGPYCMEPCPPEARSCNEVFFRCAGVDDDPRGRESCGVDLSRGYPYCYRGERLCVTWELHRPREQAWSGVCVHPEYCRWLLEQPELTDIRCRYSEGTLFENGPPDQPCGTGADELFGFCGGRCGDTCPEPFGDWPSCVGISETRGFGVCAWSRDRCLDHGSSVSGIPPGGACMFLSPMALPEYAGHGWSVALETCVAYRAQFPEEVRCLGIDGRDL